MARNTKTEGGIPTASEMGRRRRLIWRLASEEAGRGGIELVLVLGLIFVLALAFTIFVLGHRIAHAYSNIGRSLTNPSHSSPPTRPLP